MTTTSDESPTSTTTVATNFIFTEEERERMSTALEMVEDALDVEHWREEGFDSDSDSECDSKCDGDETQQQQHHHHHHDRQELEANFHREQEEKRHSLFRSAIAIQESVAGFYHPDVANTYHFYGWFLYERSRHAHALVCFLQALKICYRLLGSEHTSTRVVLDDLRFVATEHERDLREQRERREQERNRRNLRLGSSLPAAATAPLPTRKRTLAESFNDEPVRLEEDCSAVFESWECQYYAEDALLALKNPSTALEWYREAIKVLPTRTIPTCTADYDDDNNNDENDHNFETEDETITSSCHEHEHEHEHEHVQENPKETDSDTDTDANSDHVYPGGGSSGRPQSHYHPSEDFAVVCLGELERATVQMHIGDVLYFSMDHAAPPDPRHRERNTERCLRDAAGWYRCALEVLPRWLSPDHPILERLERDASSARAEATRMRRERLSGTEHSTTTDNNTNINTNSEG